MTQSILQAARIVTDAEVAFYRENGWVKLEQLISAEAARELLEASQALLGEDGRAVDPRAGVDVEFDWWNDRHFLAREGYEPFKSLCYSAEMGHNTQRLLERPVAVRYFSDMLACKLPASGGHKGAPTMVHQDLGVQFDRIGKTTFWIALDDIPPERGAMRFWSGSQKEGPLGNRSPELFTTYPYLADRYSLSDPVHLKPGDATVHSQMVIHQAPANTTDRPRWAYIVLYFPADALYSGRGERLESLGLEENKPFDQPIFPIVYE